MQDIGITKIREFHGFTKNFTPCTCPSNSRVEYTVALGQLVGREWILAQPPEVVITHADEPVPRGLNTLLPGI